MKRLLIILLVAVSFATAFANDEPASPTMIRRKAMECIYDYMGYFPDIELRDVYKMLFQGELGVEHLLSDTASARKYLHSEIEEFGDNLQGPDFLEIGLDKNYIQVNLRLVKTGSISEESLVKAMVMSARPVNKADIDMWRDKWNVILWTLKDMNVQFDDFENDIKTIEETFEAGQYAVHHSKKFNTNYNFHYRIVRRDVFIKLVNSAL